VPQLRVTDGSIGNVSFCLLPFNVEAKPARNWFMQISCFQWSISCTPTSLKVYGQHHGVSYESLKFGGSSGLCFRRRGLRPLLRGIGGSRWRNLHPDWTDALGANGLKRYGAAGSTGKALALIALMG